MEKRERFELFNKANPEVYKLYKKMALEICAKGERVGSKHIVERIRWEHKLKVSNDFTAYYSRRFVADFPYYKHLFKLNPLTSC